MTASDVETSSSHIVPTEGEKPLFAPGDEVRIIRRFPIGHYRVLPTAQVRFLVLPKRPAGTEGLSEEQLAALVTRDAMIGVVPAEFHAKGLCNEQRTLNNLYPNKRPSSSQRSGRDLLPATGAPAR